MVVMGCQRTTEYTPQPSVPVIITYSVNDLETSTEFAACSESTTPLLAPPLVEASGIAVSRHDPSKYWSHNDSGHPNRLYLINREGQLHATYILTGAGSRDYEDICMGPGPDPTLNYIYLGDIGDNLEQYPFIIIYRFPEPFINEMASELPIQLAEGDIERIELTYPDRAHDAEALMIDPYTKDLYIVTKRDFRSLVYRAKYPQSTAQRDTLELVAQLPFNWVVASDISQDGTQIVLKDFSKLYRWQRSFNQTIVDALQTPPMLLPYTIEPQGESFGWSPDGNEYVTLSEQSGIYPPDIYVYKK